MGFLGEVFESAAADK